MNLKITMALFFSVAAMVSAQRTAFVEVPIADSAAAPVENKKVSSAVASSSSEAPVIVSSSSLVESSSSVLPESSSSSLAESSSSALMESSSSVLEQPASSDSPKSLFDNFSVRGAAYNMVGNAAADYSVEDLLARPDLFAQYRFFYVEPANERGVVSFGGSRHTIFASLDVSGDVGRGLFGYANASGWGVGARLGLGQHSRESGDTKVTGAFAGDDWGVVASAVMRGFAISLDVDFLTYAEETNVQPEYGKSQEEEFNDLSAKLTFSNAPSSSKFSFAFIGEFRKHSREFKIGGDDVPTTPVWDVEDENANSFMEIKGEFDLGYKALSRERARVFVGVNTTVPVVIFDDFDSDENAPDVTEDLLSVGLILSPNVLGEVAFASGLLFYGEASYDWLAFGMETGTDASDEDCTVLETISGKTTATLGLRYQYENLLAVDFALGDSFFTSTKSIFNGEDVFVSFGAFLYF